MKNPTRAGLEVAVASEKGLRDENQDWLSWTQGPRGELFIVADGMGGYSGGMRAAKMTVEGIEQHLAAAPPDWPFATALQNAVSRTNADVHRAAHSGDPDTENMGSTVVVALVTNGHVQVGHVGDSRAYLYRGRKLQQLTRDHTRVQQMLDAGMLTEEQAREHPEGHMLSRAIGSRPEVEVEVASPIPLEEGDALLLCSDGLTGYVADEQIRKALDAQRNVQRVPSDLVKLALSSGGSDNVTVQLIRVGKGGRPLGSEPSDSGRVTAKLPARVRLRPSRDHIRVAKKAALWATIPLVASLAVGTFLWLRPTLEFAQVKSDATGATLKWSAKRANELSITPRIGAGPTALEGDTRVEIPAKGPVTYTATATRDVFGLKWAVEKTVTVSRPTAPPSTAKPNTGPAPPAGGGSGTAKPPAAAKPVDQTATPRGSQKATPPPTVRKTKKPPKPQKPIAEATASPQEGGRTWNPAIG